MDFAHSPNSGPSAQFRPLHSPACGPSVDHAQCGPHSNLSGEYCADQEAHCGIHSVDAETFPPDTLRQKRFGARLPPDSGRLALFEFFMYARGRRPLYLLQGRLPKTTKKPFLIILHVLLDARHPSWCLLEPNYELQPTTRLAVSSFSRALIAPPARRFAVAVFLSSRFHRAVFPSKKRKRFCMVCAQAKL